MSDSRRGFLYEAFFNGNGVAKKLIFALVVFSSVVTALLTALELYAEYRRDIGQVQRSLDYIGESALPSLTNAVWVADGPQLQLQLNGLLHLRDIEYASIEAEGKLQWSAGQITSKRQEVVVLPLVREHRGQPLTIGRLTAVASIDGVIDRLWDRVFVTLISNAAKTLLVAGFLLLVFQYLVTRHLTHLSEFVRGIDAHAPHGEQLQLDRAGDRFWRPDILDAVQAAINRLSQALHQANTDLRGSEQRLRTLTQETTAFIGEIDHEGRILFANREPGGQANGSVEGHPFTDWIVPAQRDLLLRKLGQAQASATLQDLECEVLAPDGATHTHLVAIRPILRAGAVTSLALTALDISERKAAETALRELTEHLDQRVRERTAQLERASAAKSEFLSHMSHELRTPLNAILGFAQIMEMSEPLPKQEPWVREIRRAGEHLLHMIEDLLNLSLIEAGKMTIDIEAMSPLDVLSEALALVQPMVDQSGLTLSWDTRQADDRLVLADRLRLRQVLVNLLSNAVKYNRDGGSITLRCEARGEHTRISVADAGIGIDDDKIERVFKPFDRLGVEKGQVEGAGIGLALSLRMAELMGATLGVHSVSGQGSTFWIDLPAAPDKPAG